MIKSGRIIFLFILTFIVVSLWPQIHQAVREGNLDQVKALLSKEPLLVNARDDMGFTPLTWAAALGRVDVAKCLIEKGAEVNPRDAKIQTPLHAAAESGSLEIIALLLDRGANIEARLLYGNTPLHVAALEGKADAAKLLIERGAKPGMANEDGQTALFYAAISENAAIMDLLLAKGADVRHRDSFGHTPLHAAAWFGKAKASEWLLAHGAKVDDEDRGGNTALHGAVYEGYRDAALALLAKGADPDHANRRGESPFALALEKNRSELAQLLKEKGAVAPAPPQAPQPAVAPFDHGGEGEKKKITLTVLYDNTMCTSGTEPDWGFSCLVQGTEKKILFDTGTSPKVLAHNARVLNVDLAKVEAVVISHDHGDHTGGIWPVLRQTKEIPVYLPDSVSYLYLSSVEAEGGRVIRVAEPRPVCSQVLLTGEMGREGLHEQSLIINTPKGLVIVTGCSHQGIVNVLKKAKELFSRDIYLVLGGFHLLETPEPALKEIIGQFKELGVQYCGATHCTGKSVIALFQEAYGDRYVPMGTGRVITITPDGIQR